MPAAGAALSRLFVAARPRQLCLSLALLVIAVYWQATTCEFTMLDDDNIVLNNAHIRGGLSLKSLRWAFTTTHHDYWHPIPWITHIIDYQLYGLVPGGHHLTSVLFHLAAVVALFLWLFDATGHLWPSALTAALFAVHPVHVEPVVWISARKDVTCVLFWNLTLLAYVRYAKRRRWSAYASAVALYAVALMSKPMAMTLPFVMLLLDWWPLGRMWTGRNANGLGMWSGGADGRPMVRRVAVAVAEKLPFFALAAASILFTYATYSRQGFISKHLSFASRLAYVPLSYLMYLRELLWPSRLGIMYPLPAAPPEPYVAFTAAVALVCLTYFAFRMACRLPWLSVGWLWFAGVLLPVSGLIHTGHQLYADRFAYVPAIGLYVPFSWLVHGAWRRLSSRWHPMAAVGIAALIGALSATTVSQVQRWKESRLLFAHTLRITTRNYPMENNMGCIFHSQGDFDSARYYYRRSIVSNRHNCKSFYNIAMSYAAQHLHDSAAMYFRLALGCNEEYTNARIGLAAALLDRGLDSAAEEVLVHAIGRDSCSPTAHQGYALYLLQHARPGEALAEAAAALRLDPACMLCAHIAGAASSALGHYRRAVIYLRAAAALMNSAEVFGDLALAYHGLGLPDSARLAFQRARELAPDTVRYALALARTLRDMGRASEALCEYRAALCLSPGMDAVRDEMIELMRESPAADSAGCPCPRGLPGEWPSQPRTPAPAPDGASLCSTCGLRLPLEPPMR